MNVYHTPKDMTQERDEHGDRTGFKVYIKIRRPMQPLSWKRWSRHLRQYIAKHKYVWVFYSSSRSIGLPNGVPVEVMKDNDTMARYFINTFILQDGETFAIHGWCAGRTKTRTQLTPALALITVHDAENMKYTVSNYWRLSRYGFRKNTQKEKREVF